jgi:hypothetical protein
MDFHMIRRRCLFPLIAHSIDVLVCIESFLFILYLWPLLFACNINVHIHLCAKPSRVCVSVCARARTCVCVHGNHISISIIKHLLMNFCSVVITRTKIDSNKRKLPVWLFTGFSLGYRPPHYVVQSIKVMQSARIAGFRGKSTSLPSKGGSKQTDLKLWKHQIAQPTGHTW